MYLEVELVRSGKFWNIGAPALDVFTQGRTKKEAALMLKDAIELLVNKGDFSITVILKGEESYLTSNDQNALLSLLLRRQRQKSGLTLQEVAGRMNSKSPNTFARYEQGKAVPSVAKLFELIRAVNPGGAAVIKFT